MHLGPIGGAFRSYGGGGTVGAFRPHWGVHLGPMGGGGTVGAFRPHWGHSKAT